MALFSRRWLLLVAVAVALLLTVLASAAREDLATTREEILASRRRRSKQIEDLLEDSKQRLMDHSTGVRLLDEKERGDLEKKITIYQRKLDTMRGDLDEREVERILKREQLQAERLKKRRAQHGEL